MGLIELSNGKVARVDEEDVERLSGYMWYATSADSRAYAMRRVTVNGKRSTVFMHREVVQASSEWKVDHINGDRLDNRKSNLRTYTTRENNRNVAARPNGSSQYKGVYYKGG